MLRWAALGVSESIDLDAWIITLIGFMEHPRIAKEKLLANYIYDVILCFYDGTKILIEITEKQNYNRVLPLLRN